MDLSQIFVLLIALVLGALALWLVVMLAKWIFVGAVALFVWAADWAFLGVAIYFACWFFMLPVMLVGSAIVGFIVVHEERSSPEECGINGNTDR